MKGNEEATVVHAQDPLGEIPQGNQSDEMGRRDFLERARNVAVVGLTVRTGAGAQGKERAERGAALSRTTSVDDGMRANDVRSNAPLRYGRYVCFRQVAEQVLTAATGVGGLILRLGFQNEFDVAGGGASRTCGFLRRVDATPGVIEDNDLLHADAIVHVSAEEAQPVDEFCQVLADLLGRDVTRRLLGGIIRPTQYTSNAMHNYAYAHRVLQQPGTVMPNAFIVPMSKNSAWWQKAWMERHTYFLPRYDGSGRMIHEGHALAAAAGVDCLMRRTYKHPSEPAPSGSYDFVNYFECTDADVPVFHEVCKSLRDSARNPEWNFVSEGPTWHGRRVATWSAMFL